MDPNLERESKEGGGFEVALNCAEHRTWTQCPCPLAYPKQDSTMFCWDVLRVDELILLALP